MAPEDIMGWLEKVNSEFGRKPISHRGKKNLTEEKVSIQGGWQKNMWNQFPKHMMEPKIVTEFHPVEGKPPKPIMEKKVRVHGQTKEIRKKYAIGSVPDFH